MVSISVAAADNTERGDWKYVVEEARGFDGDRVVLAAAIDGIYDMHDPTWAGTAEAYPAMFRPKERLRGIYGSVLHHQLGDGKVSVADPRVSEVSFGGLVAPEFISAYRVDSDLVFDVKGTPDSISFHGWFDAQWPLNVAFEHDGTRWGHRDIVSSAENREPKIIFYVASNDEYIRGGDGNDRLSGKDRNTMFLPGKGDDAVTFGGKGNILYYRRNEGHDTIVVSGGEGSHGAIHFHTDITSQDVSAARVGNDMKITAASGSITIKGWFASPNNKIEIINFFADETLWDARDIERLAEGKAIIPREVEMTFDERAAPSWK
jgi:Ca2+-binding RTX toxin-like protein